MLQIALRMGKGLESVHIGVQKLLIGLGHVKKFDAITVARMDEGRVGHPAHDVDQGIFQLERDHHLLPPFQREMGLHQDAALADVQGSGHGIFPMAASFVHHDKIEQVQGLWPAVSSAFSVHGSIPHSFRASNFLKRTSRDIVIVFAEQGQSFFRTLPAEAKIVGSVRENPGSFPQ